MTTPSEADEGWLIVTEEVERLCFSILQTFGTDVAQTLLQLFKQLDKRQVVSIEDFGTRELRKKVRHLFEAFCLSVVAAKRVPGAKHVATSFKKPSDCHISLARTLKPYLVESIRKTAELEPEEKPAPAAAEEEDIDDATIALRCAQIEEALRAIRSGSDSALQRVLEHGPEVNESRNSDDEEVGPAPAAPPPKHSGGMLSLDEYRRLKQAGAEMQPIFTRSQGNNDEEQQSLMQMRQSGKLEPSAEDLKKYE